MSNFTNKCLICDGTLVESVKSNFYQYYNCNHCKTSQLVPFPSQEELEALYYKYHLSDEEGGSYDWIEDRMKADFPIKILLIKKYFNQSEIKLLDVGCGKGFFVESCINHKINAIGIDISQSGVDYANNILKIKAENTDIINFSTRIENQNYYDAITLWATIEHLPNPQEVFNAIYTCFNLEVFYFSTPG